MNEFGSSAIHVSLYKILKEDQYKKHHRAVARALESMNHRCALLTKILDRQAVVYMLTLLIKTAKLEFSYMPKTVQTHARNAMVANIRTYLNGYLGSTGKSNKRRPTEENRHSSN